MASGRAIRIVRQSATTTRVVRAEAPTDYRVNRAGTQRALRLFALFAGALAALFGLLLTLLDVGPGGLGGNAGLLGTLGLLGAVLMVVGFQVTLGQTPTAIVATAHSLVVRERLGRRRAFPPASELGPVIARRFPAGWLSSEPTVIVRLKDTTGAGRTYLVQEGVVPTPGGAG